MALAVRDKEFEAFQALRRKRAELQKAKKEAEERAVKDKAVN